MRCSGAKLTLRMKRIQFKESVSATLSQNLVPESLKELMDIFSSAKFPFQQAAGFNTDKSRFHLRPVDSLEDLKVVPLTIDTEEVDVVSHVSFSAQRGKGRHGTLTFATKHIPTVPTV